MTRNMKHSFMHTEIYGTRKSARTAWLFNLFIHRNTIFIRVFLFFFAEKFQRIQFWSNVLCLLLLLRRHSWIFHSNVDQAKLMWEINFERKLSAKWSLSIYSEVFIYVIAHKKINRCMPLRHCKIICANLSIQDLIKYTMTIENLLYILKYKRQRCKIEVDSIY